MKRDYSNIDRDYEHSIKGIRNNYRNKFFHDIDLNFILSKKGNNAVSPADIDEIEVTLKYESRSKSETNLT